MPSVTPISGVGAKSPACFLVDTGESRLMLDLGHGPQPGLWPDVSGVGHVDAVVLTHSHGDHAGGLRLLPEIGSPPVYATEIAAAFFKSPVPVRSLPLMGTTTIAGVRITTGRSGHAPGGVWLHLDVGGGLLYTGDYCRESALYAFDPPPAADTLILDGSYGDYDRSQDDVLNDFIEFFTRGSVLLPVPAAGRGPEIALLVASATGTQPCLGAEVRGVMSRLADDASVCLLPSAADALRKLVREAPAIREARGVMLAALSGQESGEAARLVEAWCESATPEIVYTGYMPPGSPAQRLTESGRARFMRWNVHPRLSDNINTVRATRARRVIPAFGDARHLETWGRAFAPAQVHVEGSLLL